MRACIISCARPALEPVPEPDEARVRTQRPHHHHDCNKRRCDMIAHTHVSNLRTFPLPFQDPQAVRVPPLFYTERQTDMERRSAALLQRGEEE
jgi:hypothetical protein